MRPARVRRRRPPPTPDRIAGRPVEEVELLERELEVEHVARLHAVLRAHDRDDVALVALDGHVEQLLVAEELDDVGLGPDRRRVRDVAELEVLRPEAGNEIVGAVPRCRPGSASGSGRVTPSPLTSVPFA